LIGKGCSQGVVGETGIVIKYSSKMTLCKKTDRILLRRGTTPIKPWERPLSMKLLTGETAKKTLSRPSKTRKQPQEGRIQ
jgi:hypothetical protein